MVSSCRKKKCGLAVRMLTGLFTVALIRRAHSMVSSRDYRQCPYFASVASDTAHPGVAFRVEQHIDRLFATMGFLGIQSPYTKDELIEMNHRVLEANRTLCEQVAR